MRNSNYLFTKGSIVFVKFPSKSDKSFLNGRPLIVISNPTHILKTLTVCTTGTQDKPGIQASFFNHVDKCYVGDAQVSNIYPYSIMTIYTDQIVASIGQLDPFIMAEVDKAIDFHLGRTTEIPKYLENIEDELTGVTCNYINQKDIKREKISEDFIPAVNYKRQYRKSDNDDSNIGYGGYKQRFTNKDFSHLALANDDILKWAHTPVNGNIKYSDICKDPAALSACMDSISVSMICSRVVPLTLVAEKFKINKRYATYMRITLTNMLIKDAVILLKTSGHFSGADHLSDSYILGIILAMQFSKVNPKNNMLIAYKNKIAAVNAKYKINFNDKRTWKSVENFYTE